VGPNDFLSPLSSCCAHVRWVPCERSWMGFSISSTSRLAERSQEVAGPKTSHVDTRLYKGPQHCIGLARHRAGSPPPQPEGRAGVGPRPQWTACALFSSTATRARQRGCGSRQRRPTRMRSSRRCARMKWRTQPVQLALTCTCSRGCPSGAGGRDLQRHLAAATRRDSSSRTGRRRC
jgi:hypothetical protein